MELTVYSTSGLDTGKKVSLPEGLFGLETPSDHAIYMDVKYILANRRQGTHKAKERGEVSGSKKKPYRQKGTGSARAGHKRSPLWRHGGRVFGPRPRSYGFKLNKKQRTLARASALTYKAREEKISVIENFQFEHPKTKLFKEILGVLNLQGEKVLMVLPESSPNIFLAGRNLPNAKVMRAEDLNTYDILNADTIILLEGSIDSMKEKFLN